MEYLIDVQFPESETTVTVAELPGAYANLKGSRSYGVTITWNDGGDDVLIVAVADEYCVITMKTDESWYYLVVSDDEEKVSVDMAGDADIPGKAVSPRELGLTVLQRADDFPGLLTDYRWDGQWVR